MFVYRALAVGEPFGLAESPRYDLAAIAADRGWTLSIGTLASVDPARREARTAASDVHAYSALVLALGAVPVPALPGALTFTGPADAERLADALRAVTGRVAFVAVDPGWTLPLYELALVAQGIALGTGSVATEVADGAVHLEPEGPLRAGLAVALPRLRGPALPGIPDAEHGTRPSTRSGGWRARPGCSPWAT